jgi:WD40 repeat protein
MNNASGPRPTPAVSPPPSRSHGRRWVLAIGLVLLLLTGAGVGGVLWWRGHLPSLYSKTPPSDPPIREPLRSACSDDDDPKYLDPLEFGPPVEVTFERRFLDGLARRPIPEVEVYPWQPKELVAVLGEHRMRGDLIASSPDGKTLAVASSGSPYVRLGPMATLHEKTVLTCPAAVRSIHWAPVGDSLAVSGADGLVRLYDVRDPDKVPEPVILEKSGANVASLSFSGDAKYLIGGDQTPKVGTAWVWEVATRKLVARLPHTGPVQSVAFSPVPGDYRALTAGGVEDGQVHLWRAVAGEHAASIDFRPDKTNTTVYVGAVVFAPDGKRALSCHPDGLVRSWNLDRFEKAGVVEAKNYKEEHAYGGHSGSALACYSPDGKYVATARVGGAITLWHSGESRQVRALARPAGVSDVRLFADKLLYAGTFGHDHNVHLHQTETAKEILPPVGHLTGVFSVGFSPEGRNLASGAWDVRLWDAREGSQRHAVSASAHGGVGFHPSGERVFFFGANSSVVGFAEVSSGRGTTPSYDHAHSGGIRSAALTRDGRYVLTGGSDGTVRLYLIQDGKQKRRFAPEPGQGAALATVAPDMRRAIRLGGPTAQLLQLRCQQVVHQWPAPPSAAPFLPDGRALFLAAPEGTTWGVSKDGVRQDESVRADLSGLSGAALSADGKRVAGIRSGRVVVHDLSPPRLVWEWAPPAPFGGVAAASLSADGGHLMTANGDGTVYVVRLP